MAEKQVLTQEQLDVMTTRSSQYGTMEHINMAAVPLSFSRHESEKDDKNPIYLGWEWEVRIPDYKVTNTKLPLNYKTPALGTLSSEYLPGYAYTGAGAEWMKKLMSTPIRNVVNAGGGGYPVEMRSVPATLKYHREYMRDIFFKEGFHKIFADAAGCGIHIHIDPRSFTEKSMKKFIAFVANPFNTTFIEDIAGRSISGGCNWCRRNYVEFKFFKSEKLNKKIRGFNINLDPVTHKQLPTIKSVEDEVYFPSGKSVAVHTATYHKTHEFRIFNSVLTEQKFMKNLEFTDALIRFVNDPRTLNIHLNAKDFAEYVMVHSENYDYLLKEKCMIDLLVTPRKKRVKA